MKFGMSMMGLSPRYYPEIARSAETNGFESVWMPEHLMLPAVMPPTYPYSDTGYAAINGDTPMYDPWVVMATVAATTTTIRLATNVYVLTLRHPFITARSVATLDRVLGRPGDPRRRRRLVGGGIRQHRRVVPRPRPPDGGDHSDPAPVVVGGRHRAPRRILRTSAR